MRRSVLIAVGVVVALVVGLLVWAALAEVAPPVAGRVETILDEAELARP